MNFAPPPRDIYWENLADNRRWLWIKIFVSNLCLFLVALFLTTPQYIVSQLEPITLALTREEVEVPTYVKTFIPTLLLKGFTVLMPALVTLSVRWLGFWYRSEENHSIMKKSFWYLWFMVIIFPTLGLTTGFAFFENFFASTNSTEPTIRLECVFLPDSGAFFVNYVITAALIGSGLELIRFPDMFS